SARRPSFPSRPRSCPTCTRRPPSIGCNSDGKDKSPHPPRMRALVVCGGDQEGSRPLFAWKKSITAGSSCEPLALLTKSSACCGTAMPCCCTTSRARSTAWKTSWLGSCTCGTLTSGTQLGDGAMRSVGPLLRPSLAEQEGQAPQP